MLGFTDIFVPTLGFLSAVFVPFAVYFLFKFLSGIIYSFKYAYEIVKERRETRDFIGAGWYLRRFEQPPNPNYKTFIFASTEFPEEELKISIDMKEHHEKLENLKKELKKKEDESLFKNYTIDRRKI